MSEELFEQVGFTPDAQFEKIISDLMDRQYSVVPGYLSETLTEALRSLLTARYEQDQFKKAAIGNHLNEQVRSGIRGDFIHWLNRSDLQEPEQAFFTEIDRLSAYLNRTCFMGIAGAEFHYALYPPQTCYKRHLDVFRNDDRRRLSVITYLNPPDWTREDGGQLVIYRQEGQEETAIEIDPLPGQLVLLESHTLEHEVKPSRRPRLSLTGWLKTH